MEALLLMIITILLVIGIHYETLAFLSKLTARLETRPRPKILFVIIFVLFVHFFEVAVFALSFVLMSKFDFGSLSGNIHGFSDFLYFSLVTYTSLGFGDITPIGGARLAAGLESLAGLILIAWTGSFTFLQMKRYWHE